MMVADETHHEKYDVWKAWKIISKQYSTLMSAKLC